MELGLAMYVDHKRFMKEAIGEFPKAKSGRKAAR
jgi:hypothetical protein